MRPISLESATNSYMEMLLNFSINHTKKIIEQIGMYTFPKLCICLLNEAKADAINCFIKAK
jgi:hypothetical protein